MVLRAGTLTACGSLQEALPDLAGAPVGFLALGGYDGRFDLFGQLIGIAEGAPGSIREPLQSAFLITLQELIASLAGNLELPAQCGHALAVFESNYKTYAFVHNRTFLPWHFTRPPQGKKCNPCLRYVLLPMPRAGQNFCVCYSQVNGGPEPARERTINGSRTSRFVANESDRNDTASFFHVDHRDRAVL